MSNVDDQDLNTGSQPPTDQSDDRQEGNGKRKRRPSEAVRFKARLKDLVDVGIIPHAVWFDPEGGFELRLTPEQDTQRDEYEVWLNENLKKDGE